MKYFFYFIILTLGCLQSFAQETLQTVTSRGNATNMSLQIGGESVNANTTKLYINNPFGKNWALSSGANSISEQGFYIYNWSDNPNTPLLSLSNTGNLGIGTHSPAQNFVVSNNGAEGFEVCLNQPAGVVGLQSYNRQVSAYSKMQFDAAQFAFTQGNVGVGTTNPAYKLDVNGEGKIASTIITSSNSPFTSSSILYSQPGFHNMFGVDGAWTSKYFGMKTDGTFLAMGGNVGIGTTNPDEKLTVKGKIHAEEIKVDLSVPGPDYVFEKNYQLQPLSEIQEYIKVNKHLPEVPSAKEMEQNGINLSEMNMLLLKKVEELTLHLIEQENRIKKLEKIK